MSAFTRYSIGYTLAVGIGGLAAEGVNYWQRTPPAVNELRLLLFLFGLGGIAVATGAATDAAVWLWRQHRNSN